MSLEALTAAWESSAEGPTVRLVLVALACHANDGGQCWPSVGSLAERTHLKRRTVQKALAVLVEGGHLSYADGERSRGGLPGRRSTTVYNVHPQPGHGRTTFTREPRSPLNDEKEVTDRGEPRSPVNHVHPRTTFTREPRSGEGRTTFTRTVIEPKEKEEEVSELDLQDRGEPRSPVNHVHPRTTFTPDRQKRNRSFVPPIPERYGEALKVALQDWINYKTGEKRQRFTEAGWARFLKRVEQHQEAVMVAALTESMDQGWQGVFPERHQHLAASGRPAEGEKKFTGAAVMPSAPEWDWRAVYRDRFDCEPDVPEFGHLHPDMQAELRALAERRAA